MIFEARMDNYIYIYIGQIYFIILRDIFHFK